MLSVIVLRGIMLSVIMLSVIMLSVIMLSVIMINVIKLSVIMLNLTIMTAVAPFDHNYSVTKSQWTTKSDFKIAHVN